MIEIYDLEVKYRWRQEPIVKGVSAKFDGKHLILGPNGSGKTTLFRAIAGLTPITSGRVLIDGIDVSSIYGKPGLLAINLYEVYEILHVNAYDHMRLIMDLTDGDVDLALKIFDDLGLSIELLKKRKPWELSTGQRKIFCTAVALASKARHVLSRLESGEPIIVVDDADEVCSACPYLRGDECAYSEGAEEEIEKLRDRNEADGPLFKIRDDPRVTRVGRILRQTSLDELPQLINVIKGEMSLVGPRPPLPDEVAQYKAWHLKRLAVPPGITGLWQVSGRSELTFDEMVLLDIYYVEHWSPWLDLVILLRTLPKVLAREGAY